jgi:hypothetical protein
VGLRTDRRGRTHTTGSFSYRDPAVPLTFTSNKISNIQIAGNHVSFTCIGKSAIKPWHHVMFVVDVTDNGDPGTLDTFSVTEGNSYSAGGQLTSGNIQFQ